MIDSKTAAKLQKSYRQSAQGYTTATGAACATLSTAMFQAWIDGLESIRPGKENDPQPKSWYRHPDKPSLNPPENAGKSAWPFTPFQFAQMPIPGWWMFGPTRNPVTTWPMAYGLEATGVPKPVAWPLAEANSAAIETYQIAAQAMQDHLRAMNEVSFEATSKAPTSAQTSRAAPTSPTEETVTTPLDLALSWQTANAEVMTAWWGSFQHSANQALKTDKS